MKTVLVTAIGSATVDAVLSSLKRNVNLIGCDIYPRHYLTGVDSFNKFYNVPLAIDVKAYTKAIFDICTQNNV
ncbi:MAG: carbamoyl-phosphate synthase large subunit, partial [Christensenellaceae bacterium]|nr:carbamoyl-phosphate synthase large subunit [Christensenellaceae bacterium]